MEPQATHPRISDYIRPVSSRWWLVLIAVVVATAGTYAYYVRKPNVYSASTLIYVQDPGDPVTGLSGAQGSDRTVADEATLLDSRQTAVLVARRIGYSGDPGQLLGQVSITGKPGVDFVQVGATSGSAVQAAQIANAFAAQLVTSLNGAIVYQVQSALTLSRTQLAQLPRGPAAEVQRANLLDQINRLQLALQVPSTVSRQVGVALPPSSPSAPKPVRNALFALVLSLVGAIALAYGLERFNRRLKTTEDLEQAYARPLLAVLPHTGSPTPMREGRPMLGSDFREPFRLLKTNVDLAAVDDPPRTIVISSAIPGEGKSTIVRNLALAFRESGKSVAVVDLDLRHPSLPAMFAAPIGPGITEVLRHEAELDDVALRIPVAVPALDDVLRRSAVPVNGGNGGNGHNGSAEHDLAITLVQSGGRPANPPGVLSSQRLEEVLDELRERHDVVLIDSAPVVAVTDTVPLLRYADAAVFVARLDVATRDTAKRLTEFLGRVPDANVLGVVANDMPRLDAGAYGYSYSGYYDETTKARRPGRRARGRSPQAA